MTLLHYKRSVLLFLVVAILISCKKEQHATGSTTLNNATDPFVEGIDTLIADYLDLDIFSGIVLVAKGGEKLYHKAFGLSNRESRLPNTLNTLFDIGSMNKTFTSIVVKQLAEEGKLSLDDTMSQYLSGFKDPNTEKITIAHLLEHQSGFGDYHMRGYFDLPKSERKLSAIVERAKSYSLYFEPGTAQEYSNLGYVILGAIIEKASGKSYFDNVHNRIVKPLKLENTYLNNFEGLEDRIATGYYKTPLGRLVTSAPLQDEPNPDGGFLSTTEDIMRFYRSYYYDDVLLSENTKANDPYFNYLSTLPNGKATGAFGGFEGFNSALYQVYSDDLTIIVFANMDEPVAELIAENILKLYRGEIPENPKLPAVQNVRIHYEKYGIDYVKDNFNQLITNFHPTDPKDIILNMLGYAYLYEAEDKQKALDIFKLNTELFSNVANCWDSYGEALALSGETNEAIIAYNKALDIEPELESAKAALKQLKSN